MYKNIVIPVILDHPEKNKAAFEAARALADEGAHFTLLHVLEDIPVYVSEYVPNDFVVEARKTLRSKLDELSKTLPNCHAAITEGRPGTQILKWAEQNNSDCIVIASHRPNISDILLGSVAHYVVRHAKCAVHVIR
ncbi:Nucleotide-binding universal stress protein, UspA family [Sulfitobacter marinus]|uniref:Nucleotide-binding universal stress protein, UspA family n=1 Tax=Sulfitobacter marinus TaxID=394264 RepID=A0A1I6VHI1_9RHOB|nr:universal stress protein [Sulfitobacter marinus]SFT13081.1 Nucleotide-binding universal stress protein, UspA family [Sulfitobacter marinus]